MQTEQSLINRLIRYFFRGLLLIVPLGATLYVISAVLRKIDGVASFGIPGLGMIIVIVTITSLGYVGTTLLVKSAFGFTEELIKKVPLVRILYSSLKDFTTVFVDQKGKFNKPVLVLMDSTTQLYRIGFLTQESLAMLSMPEHVAVYLPNSYELAGILIIVSPQFVKPLDLPSSEVMKFNFSGAVTTLKNDDQLGNPS